MPFPPTNPALERALLLRDYLEPTPVQAAVLRPEAVERDLLVSAQTGSGKTVAYGMAFAGTILAGAERLDWSAAPLVLVVAPTRELALQVTGELAWLYDQAGAVIVSCVGGTDARLERRQLGRGCHIVVGTPGRLRDHLERGQLDLSRLRVVVLDEADEMLDLGFREDLEFILNATPPARRTLLFSATIAREIAALARRYQRDALRIDTVTRGTAHADIAYRAIAVTPDMAEGALVNVLRETDARASLVFCATREGVRRLHAVLLARGFAAVALSGELSQQDRNAALLALREGRARVCVATDVAARGLDLPDLGLVVHADLPTDGAVLLHRSGRTGRAGRKGISVLLVPAARRRRAEQLCTAAGIAAEWRAPPAAADIRRLDQQRLADDPILAEPAGDEELDLARALLAGRSAEAVAVALIRLHRAGLPAPQDIAVAEPTPRIRPPAGEMTWFRINVGRRGNADPKWLLPLLCRLGDVTRAEIGAIRIFADDTRFEVALAAAAHFGAAIRRIDDPEIRIEPAIAARPDRDRETSPARWQDRKALPRAQARPARPAPARSRAGA